MISFSNDELENMPKVKKGDTFLHKECGQLHELLAGKNEDGTETEDILYFMCKGQAKLGAINGAFLW
jgi:hypothetical protein